MVSKEYVEIKKSSAGTITNNSRSRTDSSYIFVFPNDNFNGNVRIKVDAIDNSMSVVSDTLLLSIIPINDPPEIYTINTITILEDSPFTTGISIIDNDSDSLMISAIFDTLLLHASLTDSTISVNPEENWHGSSSITIEVSDYDTTVLSTVNIVVLPVNDPPDMFNLIGPDNESELVITTASQMDSIEFIWDISNDIDGDSIYYFFTTSSALSFMSSDSVFRTSIKIPISDIIEAVDSTGEIFGTWDIKASDAQSYSNSSNGPWILRLFVTLGVQQNNVIPEKFALHANYPNPFNPLTVIKYDLPENSFVSITIFDVLGRQIRKLISKEQNAGYKSIIWDSTNNIGQPVSAGLYFYQIRAGEFVQTRKMVLLK